MRNTAFLDACGDSRMLFFERQGFSMREFERLRFGPVIQRDELQYFRELRMLEEYSVTLTLSAASEDGARFKLENRFYKSGDKLAAIVTSTGGWLSLEARKLMVPPEALKAATQGLVRAENFEILPSLVG
jgi:acyl-CoA thioester hydrolase